MNVIRSGHTFSHQGLLHPARSDVPHLPVKKPIPTGRDALVKKRIFRSILPKGWNTKEWTAVAWPTNIQSKTPDGKFGPAKQIGDWGDCWFIAALAAVANNEDGQKILAESIQKVNGGYDVTFKGSPHNSVFISDAELQEFLETEGGDADTRLLELAADRFFNESGNFKSLVIAGLIRGGWNPEDAEKCLQDSCRKSSIQDPMTYNPMRAGHGGGPAAVGFFMFTGMYPDESSAENGTTLHRSDVMRFLNQYVTNDRDGASMAIGGLENPLGINADARRLVLRWDIIRTEITANGTVDPPQRAFLNALDKWLETGDLNDLQALRSAAGNLRLRHVNLVEYVNILVRNQFKMNQDQFNLLRSGVREVLDGGLGYIGFTGSHSGTIEGINMAANTFAYFEPNNPTLVHTGELSGLIQAIIAGAAELLALDPTTERDEAESSHAGEQRGRHLRQIHNQVVRDGKIDSSESGPLANLMEMDDASFRHVYDTDKNGVIEGGELKAIQLRVDRWVDHFNLTPIW